MCALLAAEIAKQLRKFHEVEIPGSKKPQLWNDISKFFEKGSFISPWWITSHA